MLLFIGLPLFATNNGYNVQGVGQHGCVAGGTCYYIDRTSGSDSNDGLAKTAGGGHGPWKNVPGMPCATGTAAAHSMSQTDEFILKGGEVWPAACVGTGTGDEWAITTGGAVTPNSYAYPGLYVGYDPTWNDGIVRSVRVIDTGVCSGNAVLSASFSSSSGSGATATAVLITDHDIDPGDAPTATMSLLVFVTLTSGGSGYVSPPAVSFTPTIGSCTKLPTAIADITSPVIDGTGQVFGNSTNITRMMIFNPKYGTIDGLDMGHMNFYAGSSYSGGSPQIIYAGGDYLTLRNMYIHDIAENGPANAANLVGARNAAQTSGLYGGGAGSVQSPHAVLNNNVFNNYESYLNHGCDNGHADKCAANTAIYDMAQVTNNVIIGWRAGVYTAPGVSGSSSTYYLVAGNKVAAILDDPASQHPDSFYLFSSTVAYNNILRDIYSGAAAFYIETGDGSSPDHGNTQYMFNNIMFGMGSRGAGTSTPPIGWTSEFTSGTGSCSPAPNLYAYNNTFQANKSNTNVINSGQWFGNSPALSTSCPFAFTVKNNHAISDQSSGHWYAATGSCTDGCGIWNGLTGPDSGSNQAAIDTTAVIQSYTTATGQGYTANNNYAPTDSNDATVVFANASGTTNLTGLCSTSVGGISLAPLCQDINGNSRPAGGGWEAGAYRFQVSDGTLSASPVSLSFPDTVVSTNTTVPETLTNVGGTSLTITAISTNTPFSVSGITLPAVLVPGGSVIGQAKFAPMAVGPYNDNIAVTHTGTNSPLLIPVSGTGVPPGNLGNPLISFGKNIRISGDVKVKSLQTVGDFYVDPVNGLDINPGTFFLPFQTIDHARLMVRGMPSGKRVVVLRGGTYQLASSLLFDSGDSGATNTPIVYVNYAGETPIVTGAKKIVAGASGLGGSWVTDGGKSCGANCTAKYITVNSSAGWRKFEALYYNGMRRLRPQARGTFNGWYHNACDTSAQSLADSCVTAGNLTDANLACSKGPDGTVWSICGSGRNCAAAGSECGTGQYKCMNKFRAVAGDIDPTWHAVSLGETQILNEELWSYGRGRIRHCENIAGNIVCWMTGAAWGQTDGLTGCIAKPSSGSAYAYLVDNVWEKAQAGQWYLDECPSNQTGDCTTPETTWRLYIFQDNSIGENPATADIQVPQLDPTSPWLLRATSLHDVTIQGVDFRIDGAQLDAQGSGYAIDEGTGGIFSAELSFQDSNNIILAANTVEKGDQDAIEFLGSSHDNTIQDTKIFDLGREGIKLGLKAQLSDTPTTVVYNNKVSNTVIAYYEQVYPSGNPAAVVIGNGHDNLLQHLTTFGSYGGAIELGIGFNRGDNAATVKTSYQIYGNKVLDSKFLGRTDSGGKINTTSNDFGVVHTLTSLSANCPQTVGKPTDDLHYCNEIGRNFMSLFAHNNEDTNELTSKAVYLDNSSAYTFVHDNTIAYIGGQGITAHIQNKGVKQYWESFNLLRGNTSYKTGDSGSKFNSALEKLSDGPNQLEYANNLVVINSAVQVNGKNSTHFQRFPNGQYACFGGIWVAYTSGQATGVTFTKSASDPACGGNACVLIRATGVTGQDLTFDLTNQAYDTLDRLTASIVNAGGHYRAGTDPGLFNTPSANLTNVTNQNICMNNVGTCTSTVTDPYADYHFPDACVNRFNMHHNGYFNLAAVDPNGCGANCMEFAVPKVHGVNSPYDTSHFYIYKQSNAMPSGWQATFNSNGSGAGEDTGSIVLTANPFVNPAPFNGDWHLTAAAKTALANAGIPFTEMDITKVGASALLEQSIPAVTEPFPLRLVDPTQDF